LPDPLQSSRRFSEKEIGLILRRASELQVQDPEASVSPEAGGLSLAELEQVAREAGIDPQYIRRAATDISTAGVAPDSTPFLGAPVRLEFERTVEGEVPESAYVILMEEIQQTLGPAGVVNTLGRSFAWHSTNVQRQVSVTITPRQGRTRIRIEERLHNLAGGLFGGVVGGMGGAGISVAIGVGMSSFNAPLVATVLSAAMLLGAYGIARTVFRGVSGRRSRDLRRLADVLAERVEENAGRGGSV